MKYIFLFVFLVVSHALSLAQEEGTPDGNQLKNEGKLEAAIEAYKSVFQKNPDNSENTYNLAQVYALTFQADSAFHYLPIALKKDTTLWSLADADLFALIHDPRWVTIQQNQMDKYQATHHDITQPEYALKLLNLILIDQSLDYYIDQAKASFMQEGYAPQWYYPIGAYKQEIIKDNYETMQKLVEEYGWPKYSTVGKIAADAPLLVINHHEQDAVREKYLPLIKQSCLDAEGSCVEYAKIQDRVLVNADQLQLYGMQFRFNEARTLEPFPITEPEYVDQRRAAIGLEPLKDYLKRRIDYDWTVPQKSKD